MATKTAILNLANEISKKTSNNSKRNSNGRGKKKRGFWSHVSDALGVAADLVPYALPFIMKDHPQMNHPVAKSLLAGSAPLAAGSASLTSMQGLKGFRVTGQEPNGTVTEVETTTLEYLGDLSADGFVEGEIMAEVPISPMHVDFNGTIWQQQARSYERWKFAQSKQAGHKGSRLSQSFAVIYQPTCAATTSGSVSIACFNDPDVTLNPTPSIENVRKCGSQAGSSTQQVWQSGVCCLPNPTDGTIDFYTDPRFVDLRLAAAGVFYAVATTDIAAGVVPGQLFFMAKTRWNVLTIVDTGIASARVIGTGPGTVVNEFAPMTAITEQTNALNGGKFELQAPYTFEGAPQTGNSVVGLPPGRYLGFVAIVGTTCVDLEVKGTDEGTFYGNSVNQIIAGLISTTEIIQIFQLRVDSLCPDFIPCLAIQAQATTITNTQFWITQMNQDILVDDPLESQRRACCTLPKRGSMLNQTLTGRMQAQTAYEAHQLSVLKDQVSRLMSKSEPLVPLAPPPCRAVYPAARANKVATKTLLKKDLKPAANVVAVPPVEPPTFPLSSAGLLRDTIAGMSDSSLMRVRFEQ